MSSGASRGKKRKVECATICNNSVECITMPDDSDDDLLAALDFEGLDFPVVSGPGTACPISKFTFKRPCFAPIVNYPATSSLMSSLHRPSTSPPPASTCTSLSLREKVYSVLHDHFGIQEFRGQQLHAIEATLGGSDVFVVMATGGGKSLCFQLPSIVSGGVTVVLSPLRSLVDDQLQKARSLGIRAGSLSQGMPCHAVNSLFMSLLNSGIQLLYVTPEMINVSKRLKNALDILNSKRQLSRFVFDEAHCVSEWGNDFRPSYRKLQWLRNTYSSVPFMALSASASPAVRIEVCQLLGLRDPQWFVGSYNRANLMYKVVPKSSNTIQDIVEEIVFNFMGSSGIVFCLSKADCEKVVLALQNSGIQSTTYHANLSFSERESRQRQWLQNEILVVVATVAFGMGIDKEDVRFVIHYNMPKSVSAYYQESGRGGRDGAPCTCILYFAFKDFTFLQSVTNESSRSGPFGKRQCSVKASQEVREMAEFAANTTVCRRAMLLNFLGQAGKDCQQDDIPCDICKSKKTFVDVDISAIALDVLALVENLHKSTLPNLADILKGSKVKRVVTSGHDKLKHHGMLKDWTKNNITNLIHTLILKDHLKLFFIKNYKHFSNCYITKGDAIVGQLMFKKILNGKEKEISNNCYVELCEVNRTMADALGVSPQTIFSCKNLQQMALSMPQTKEELLRLPDITLSQVAKFGDPFLDVIRR